jgi:hypothetical protein
MFPHKQSLLLAGNSVQQVSVPFLATDSDNSYNKETIRFIKQNANSILWIPNTLNLSEGTV